MSVEGRVEIDIARDPSVPVRVAFSRPDDVAAVLRGRTPDEAVKLIPKIFALCATAQANASASALEAALGTEVRREHQALRQCLTDMETFRENVLRILLDWPVLLGEAVGHRDLKPLMQLLPRLRAACFGSVEPFSPRFITSFKVDASLDVIQSAKALVEGDVLGEPIADWLSRARAGDLTGWTQAGKTVAARLLGAVRERGWDRSGATELVPLRPLSLEALSDWLERCEGLPAVDDDVTPESTMLTRHAGDAGLEQGVTPAPPPGLWERLVARLISVALLPEQISNSLSSSEGPVRRLSRAGDFGASEVHAARGTLVHAVRLRGGRISHYGIIPPTRWNFDAKGVAARALMSLDRKLAVSRPELVSMLVGAIDPCVGVSVRVH